MASTNRNSNLQQPQNGSEQEVVQDDPYMALVTMEDAADYYEMIMRRTQRRFDAEMEKMEKVVVESGKECVICLQEVEVGKEATQLPCKHVFHRTCVGHWLFEQQSCPTCRDEVWRQASKAETSEDRM